MVAGNRHRYVSSGFLDPPRTTAAARSIVEHRHHQLQLASEEIQLRSNATPFVSTT
jgi:hypothetical protein